MDPEQFGHSVTRVLGLIAFFRPDLMYRLSREENRRLVVECFLDELQRERTPAVPDQEQVPR